MMLYTVEYSSAGSLFLPPPDRRLRLLLAHKAEPQRTTALPEHYHYQAHGIGVIYDGSPWQRAPLLVSHTSPPTQVQSHNYYYSMYLHTVCAKSAQAG